MVLLAILTSTRLNSTKSYVQSTCLGSLILTKCRFRCLVGVAVHDQGWLLLPANQARGYAQFQSRILLSRRRGCKTERKLVVSAEISETVSLDVYMLGNVSNGILWRWTDVFLAVSGKKGPLVLVAVSRV